MYLVICARDEGGYYIRAHKTRGELLEALNEGDYRENYGPNPDLTFLDTLPRQRVMSMSIEEQPGFDPNALLIVEAEIVKPVGRKVTTEYTLEEG